MWENYPTLLESTKTCMIYSFTKKLSDIDVKVLSVLIEKSVAETKKGIYRAYVLPLYTWQK